MADVAAFCCCCRMIMEFCEKGSLERAVNQGRFIRRADKLPELVSHLL